MPAFFVYPSESNKVPFVPLDAQELEPRQYPVSQAYGYVTFYLRICRHKEHCPPFDRELRVKWICPNCGMESFMTKGFPVENKKYKPKQKGF